MEKIKNEFIHFKSWGIGWMILANAIIFGVFFLRKCPVSPYT